MAAYFDALNAFPQASSAPQTVNLKISGPPLKFSEAGKATVSVPALGATATSSLSFPSVPFNGVTVPARISPSPGSAPKLCYGQDVKGNGIVGSALANAYGLAYPNKELVFTSLRNGYSPDCRYYQLNHLLTDNQEALKANVLFVRSLFWRDQNGAWKPEDPPKDVPLNILDTLGNHAFYTTQSACVSDFILLGINATANSHAAAQNSQKGGPTPALGG